MSERYPGSREEDAWLSDAQLERCAPAETEPFQSPVPTRMISNGEYMPFPQTAKQRQVELRVVELRVKELADKASKKLGMTRRQFLESTGGLAASFLAMNEVYGNTFFKVGEVEMFEKAAFAENATPHNLFVFDDQTHIVRSSTNNPQGLRALAQGPGPVSTGAGFSRRHVDILEPNAAPSRFSSESRSGDNGGWRIPSRPVHQPDVSGSAD